MLNLVDLAGSERLKKSASEGQRKIEALHINSSLTALGKVLYHFTVVYAPSLRPLDSTRKKNAYSMVCLCTRAAGQSQPVLQQIRCVCRL